jgi:hypothetical protein
VYGVGQCDLRLQVGKWQSVMKKSSERSKSIRTEILYSEAEEHYKGEDIFFISKPSLLCEILYKSEMYL